MRSAAVFIEKSGPTTAGALTPDMQVSQREIFGPILPIRTYRNKEEVAEYINSHDRPLALYPFTHDRQLQDFYISNVMSGGVGVNEALQIGRAHV